MLFDYSADARPDPMLEVALSLTLTKIRIRIVSVSVSVGVGPGNQDPYAALLRVCPGSATPRGSVSRNRLPLPGSLSTEMRPPSAPASSLQMARPRPVPLPRPLVV